MGGGGGALPGKRRLLGTTCFETPGPLQRSLAAAAPVRSKNSILIEWRRPAWRRALLDHSRTDWGRQRSTINLASIHSRTPSPVRVKKR